MRLRVEQLHTEIGEDKSGCNSKRWHYGRQPTVHFVPREAAIS